jgi:metal-dependent hydrolase (beta-lactamase superfamily II)
MAVIDTEGKFNENSYLIDTMLMNQEKNLAHYVVEKDGMRLMIDIGISSISARRMVKRMKAMGIYPIHKIILTHSHWDHMQGVEIYK